MREIAQQFKIDESEETPIYLNCMNKFDTRSPRYSKKKYKGEEDDSSSESGVKMSESKEDYSEISSSISEGNK